MSLLTSTDQKKRLLGLMTLQKEAASGCTGIQMMLPFIVKRFLEPKTLDKKNNLIERRIAYQLLRTTPVYGTTWVAIANAIDRDILAPQQCKGTQKDYFTTCEVAVAALRTVLALPYGHIEEYLRNRWDSVLGAATASRNSTLRIAALDAIIAYCSPPLGMERPEREILVNKVLARPRFAETVRRLLVDVGDVDVCTKAFELVSTLLLMRMPSASYASPTLLIAPASTPLLTKLGITDEFCKELAGRVHRMQLAQQEVCLPVLLAICLAQSNNAASLCLEVCDGIVLPTLHCDWNEGGLVRAASCLLSVIVHQKSLLISLYPHITLCCDKLVMIILKQALPVDVTINYVFEALYSMLPLLPIPQQVRHCGTMLDAVAAMRLAVHGKEPTAETTLHTPAQRLGVVGIRWLEQSLGVLASHVMVSVLQYASKDEATIEAEKRALAAQHELEGQGLPAPTRSDNVMALYLNRFISHCICAATMYKELHEGTMMGQFLRGIADVLHAETASVVQGHQPCSEALLLMLSTVCSQIVQPIVVIFYHHPALQQIMLDCGRALDCELKMRESMDPEQLARTEALFGGFQDSFGVALGALECVLPTLPEHVEQRYHFLLFVFSSIAAIDALKPGPLSDMLERTTAESLQYGLLELPYEAEGQTIQEQARALTVWELSVEIATLLQTCNYCASDSLRTICQAALNAYGDATREAATAFKVALPRVHKHWTTAASPVITGAAAAKMLPQPIPFLCGSNFLSTACTNGEAKEVTGASSRPIATRVITDVHDPVHATLSYAIVQSHSVVEVAAVITNVASITLPQVHVDFTTNALFVPPPSADKPAFAVSLSMCHEPKRSLYLAMSPSDSQPPSSGSSVLHHGGGAFSILSLPQGARVTLVVHFMLGIDEVKCSSAPQNFHGIRCGEWAGLAVSTIMDAPTAGASSIAVGCNITVSAKSAQAARGEDASPNDDLFAVANEEEEEDVNESWCSQTLPVALQQQTSLCVVDLLHYFCPGVRATELLDNPQRDAYRIHRWLCTGQSRGQTGADQLAACAVTLRHDSTDAWDGADVGSCFVKLVESPASCCQEGNVDVVQGVLHPKPTPSVTFVATVGLTLQPKHRTALLTDQYEWITFEVPVGDANSTASPVVYMRCTSYMWLFAVRAHPHLQALLAQMVSQAAKATTCVA